MLQIVHTPPCIAPDAGGPSRSVPELCIALANLKQQVHIVSTYVPHKHRLDEWFASDQVDTTYIPSSFSIDRWWWTPDFGRKLTTLLSKTNKTIVHDHGLWWPTNGTTAKVAQSHHHPLVLSPRGMLETWSMQYHQVRKTVAWHLYQYRRLQAVTLFHATSTEEATNIRRLGFEQPIALIPNGVDITQAKLRPTNLPADRTRTLLFLSRIHPKKGLLDLVAALAKVPTDGWQVLIVGPDENGHQAEVEAAVAEAGLQSVFKFVGSVANADKWAIYQQADLFVLPTYSENFGIVVAEALSCGVPVITTTGTPWQELNSEQCGWWIEPEIDALTAALRSAMSMSDAQRTELGRRGAALIEQKYTWTRIGEMMLAAYRYILDSASTPPAFVSLN